MTGQGEMIDMLRGYQMAERMAARMSAVLHLRFYRWRPDPVFWRMIAKFQPDGWGSVREAISTNVTIGSGEQS